MKHIVGFSGGIDSQACARWVLERENHADVILLNSDAGGNESPLTTAFVERYSREVFPVTTVTAIVADMGGRAKQKIAEMGLVPECPLTFGLMAELRGRFPSRRMQFCTETLKIIPQKRWIEVNIGDEECVRYSGVRWDESAARRKRWKHTQWDELVDCELRCPIIDWSKQQCFDYVKSFGEPINELYTLGFNRVGCAPCINSGKEDVRAWADRQPEMIDKVREWEKRVGRTFFAPCVPGKTINWIDEVVEWSRTERGGKQISLAVMYERPACESKYGLCE